MADMAQRNDPFKPTIGATPPALVGRDEVIEDFADALDAGPGAHERITVVTGQRGVGKTALLNEFERTARQRGWLYFSETAIPGFIKKLRDDFLQADHEYSSGPTRRLTGFNVAGFGLHSSVQEPGLPELDLRESLTQLLDDLQEASAKASQDPVGVLITLDELHPLRREEIVEFAAVIQHLVRENREIAVVMAGIPSSVSPLLSGESNGGQITFLRRANRVELGAVSHADVKTGLRVPVDRIGAGWEDAALEYATAACSGYPFLIQLVGSHSFRSGKNGLITKDAAAKGVDKARRKLGQLVHDPALRDLSDVDRTFLVAMAQDDGPSKVSAVAQRMNVSAQYAANYRRRLLDAEMILAPARGFVDYSLPYMREYLREHVVQDLF